jgi:hypothetical protein
MDLISGIAGYFSRQRRIRSVTSVASRHSRRLFPQDRPSWSMVAEDRPNECVVYITYDHKESANHKETAGALSPHRFFRVELPNLAVTALQEDYYPAQWGPYH